MAKRGNGEGSVSARPRADGLWVARYTVIEDGIARRPALYGRTREEASRKLRAALVARDDRLKGQRKPVRDERPLHPGGTQVISSTKFIRIVALTPDGISHVWVDQQSIESIEAANDGQTTVRLRSGRSLLLDRRLDAVLHDLGHEVDKDRSRVARIGLHSYPPSEDSRAGADARPATFTLAKGRGSFLYPCGGLS